MSTRAAQYSADVLRREQLSSHLVRLVLGGGGLAGFTSTGIPDEWVALTVPGQFQTRYYTVRAWDGAELTLDVVVHEVGLVTEWASGDCVGDTVTVSEPKWSFDMPRSSQWSRSSFQAASGRVSRASISDWDSAKPAFFWYGVVPAELVTSASGLKVWNLTAFAPVSAARSMSSCATATSPSWLTPASAITKISSAGPMLWLPKRTEAGRWSSVNVLGLSLG